MQFEFSAGGLVIKKVHDKVFLLLIKDLNNNWTFPKGLIEKGEKAEDAAQREIKEETGISQIKLLVNLAPIQYWYKRDDLIKKSVKYFLYEEMADEMPKAQKEEGISKIKWVEINEALKIVGYKKTNENLIKETLTMLPENCSTFHGLTVREIPQRRD